MRSNSRKVVLALMVALALSAVAVASASAALPEFKPVPAKKKFTSAAGTVNWGTQENGSITCSKSSGAGEITSASTVGKLVLKFTGCKGNPTEDDACAVNSKGAGSGEIVTKALEGELGTVPTTQAPSGVGLVLEAEADMEGEITYIEGTCIKTARWEGALAGEVSTVAKKQLTNMLSFATTQPDAPKIKAITVKSGTRHPNIVTNWGGHVAPEAATELKFEEALEVT